MLSSTPSRALPGILAAATAAVLLVGCAGGAAPAPEPAESGADGGYAPGTWQVKITSTAADKAFTRPMEEWYMDDVEARTNGAIRVLPRSGQ